MKRCTHQIDISTNHEQRSKAVAAIVHLRFSHIDGIVEITKGFGVKVRDLERLLASHGVGKAKIDATTRKLREAGRLPIGGRGLNAPEIEAGDAAIVLLAIAGSSKAIEADSRVRKLEKLCRANSDGTLIEELTGLLTEPDRLIKVSEVRVSRNRRQATVLLADGQRDEFGQPEPREGTDRFYVEGILSRRLIALVASQLSKSRQP